VELIDQAADLAARRGQHGGDCFFQRQVLDPLGRPFRAELGARDPPDLFRIRFEKRLEQALAEPVGHPVLERFFLPVRKEMPPQVALQKQKRGQWIDVAQRITCAQRVVEKFTLVEDPRKPVARQKILLQDAVPDVVDHGMRGEEPVPAHVEKKILSI